MIVHVFSLVPVEAPQGVTVSRSSDGRSMTVSWVPLTLMKARGFPFYIIMYTSNDAIRIRRDTPVQVIVYDADSVLISGLDPFTDYSVSVTVSSYGNRTGMVTGESAGMTSVAVKSESMAYTITFYGRNPPPPHHHEYIHIDVAVHMVLCRNGCSSSSCSCDNTTVLLLCVLVSSILQ